MNKIPLIRVVDLEKTFKVLKRQPGLVGGLRTLFSTNYKEIRAVDHISFEIKEGELIGYIGPNGAGKSTTIKMLTGILYPTGGKIVVDDLIPYQERAHNSKQIGVVFGQRSQLFWDLPPRDTFEMLRTMYAIPAERYKANLEQFSELLELKDLLDRPVRQLSLGQRMRCELVASLLHDPKIVYLDEPTIGLDVVAKERIREFLQYLNRERKTTILLTTHDIAEIEKLCRRIIIIDKGRVIYDGSLTAIKQRYGRLRRVVFSVKYGETLDKLPDQLALIGNGIHIDAREDQTTTLSFDPHLVSASEITRHIVNHYTVTDLSVEEADIEVIIREIYERGTTDGV